MRGKYMEVVIDLRAVSIGHVVLLSVRSEVMTV